MKNLFFASACLLTIAACAPHRPPMVHDPLPQAFFPGWNVERTHDQMGNPVACMVRSASEPQLVFHPHEKGLTAVLTTLTPSFVANRSYVVSVHVDGQETVVAAAHPVSQNGIASADVPKFARNGNRGRHGHGGTPVRSVAFDIGPEWTTVLLKKIDTGRRFRITFSGLTDLTRGTIAQGYHGEFVTEGLSQALDLATSCPPIVKTGGVNHPRLTAEAFDERRESQVYQTEI